MRGDDPVYKLINTTNNSTTLPITGLQAYTKYFFFVRAVNNEGVGPYSSPVDNTTLEAGTCIRDLIYTSVMFVVV